MIFFYVFDNLGLLESVFSLRVVLILGGLWRFFNFALTPSPLRTCGTWENGGRFLEGSRYGVLWNPNPNRLSLFVSLPRNFAQYQPKKKTQLASTKNPTESPLEAVEKFWIVYSNELGTSGYFSLVENGLCVWI